MRKKLLFATHNRHKFAEVKAALGDKLELLSLDDINFHEDIPETGNTLEANALQKARFVSEKTGIDCFSDDTGLEVEALNNEPGVFSARFAGPGATSEENVQLLLQKMIGKDNRNAKFRTVFALIRDKQEFLFQGEVCGKITAKKGGSSGFGYDPVFQPDGHDRTFAEMSLEEKNKISHRAKALEKLIAFLKNS